MGMFTVNKQNSLINFIKNKPGTVHVFHHNDDDGKVAAAIIKKYVENDLERETKYYSLSYDKLFDISNIYFGDIVFILDFNINKYHLDKFFDIVSIVGEDSIIWIDHHLSKIEEEYPRLKSIHGYRDTRYCGAMLTYFYIAFDYVQNEFRQDIFKKYFEKSSLFLKYIDAYDCFKFEKFPKDSIFNFHYGFGTEDKRLDNDLNWLSLITDEDCNIDKYINYGEIIQKYKDFEEREIILQNSFEYDFKDFKMLVANSHMKTSLIFGDDILNKYDICCVFTYKNNCYDYSLYTNKKNINVAKIAKQFNSNGGGHAKAAGFILDYNIFNK